MPSEISAGARQHQAAGTAAHALEEILPDQEIGDLHQMGPRNVMGGRGLLDGNQPLRMCRREDQQPQRIFAELGQTHGRCPRQPGRFSP
jgi:hypothetical protein